MHKLSEECLRIQIESDYGKTKSFVEEWSAIGTEVGEMMEDLDDLPYEVHLAYRVN